MKRLVVWGARDSLDSIRHPWRCYHETALKLGIDSVWVDDRFPLPPAPGDVVLAADVTAKNLPYVGDVDYVLHNFSGSDDLPTILERYAPERLLRLQVWTHDATGERWDRYRQFDRAGRVLFQPWGSRLLAEEFMPPAFNPDSNVVSFVGAVWSDQYQGVELGNEAVIAELRTECESRGLRFEHQTQISEADMIMATRGARLAPAFAGAWQVEHGYLPCRYFSAASMGQLAFGNVREAEDLLGGGSIGSDLCTVGEALDIALALDEEAWVALVRAQQEKIARYTYRESIEAIERALAEIKQ